MQSDQTSSISLHRSESKVAPHLSLLVFSVLTGSAYVAAKMAMGGTGPFTTAFLRFFIACCITWPVLLLTRGVQKIQKEHVLSLIAYGLFQTTFYFALQYFGLQFTTSSETSLIVNARPIFLAILAVIIYREGFSLGQWLALLISFCGVLFIFYKPGGTIDSAHAFGNFLIVLNALSGAIGIMFGKKLLKTYRPFTLLVYQITVGMLGLLPLALYETGGSLDLSLVVWGPIIYLSLFSTAIAQTSFNWGLARLPVSTSGVYFYLVPVFTLILAQVMFGETITWQIIVGGILIITGAYLVNRIGQKRSAAIEEAVISPE